MRIGFGAMKVIGCVHDASQLFAHAQCPWRISHL